MGPFTRTGVLLLVVTGFYYLASLTSQSSLLLTVIGLLGGCFLFNFLAARRAVKNLHIQTPPAAFLSEGQRLSPLWRVSNLGRQPAGFIRVESAAGLLLRLGALEAGATVAVAPELVFSRRGVFPYERLRLYSSYPFGLMQVGRSLALPGEVVVGPAVYATDPPLAAGYDLMVGGKHKGNRRSTAGSHFAGVRPLQPGDPLKQVHWKSSAKGQGLMVKTYDEELSGRVAVVLDGGSSGQPGEYDDAIRAAGSLMFAALDAGHHVEWIDLGDMEYRLVPPFSDGQDLLTALARLESRPGSLTPERLHQAVERCSAKSALSFVWTDFPPPVDAWFKTWLPQRRPVAFYLPKRFAHQVRQLETPVHIYGGKTIEPLATTPSGRGQEGRRP